MTTDSETIPLFFFDPSQFPDPEAVRAFVRSDTYDALRESLHMGVLEAHRLPWEDLEEEGVILAQNLARDIALDLIALGEAAARETTDQPIRFERADDLAGPTDPRAVLAFQTVFDGSGTHGGDIRQLVLRVLHRSIAAPKPAENAAA